MRGRHVRTTLMIVLFGLLASGRPLRGQNRAGESTALPTGGLLVHVGCDTGERTVKLAGSGAFVVHGLERNAEKVEKTRRFIRSQGLYGRVSVAHWTSPRLPYVDGLVNVLVVEDGVSLPREEILRVLCPNGVALVAEVRGQKSEVRGQSRADAGSEGRKKKVEMGGRGWAMIRKPRPKEIDEWTHYLHDASNNAVAHDAVVGPPRHMHWVAAPAYSRHHERFASTSAVVSAGGRVFSISDEGLKASILFPAKWSLVARDAFSGVLLWKRPLGSWAPHLWSLFDGPPEVARRLVAVGDRVYVTLGYTAAVVALDAASGETKRTYAGTERTEEILLHDGVLYLTVADPEAKQAEAAKKRPWRVVRTPEPARGLMAVDAATGAELWRKPKAGAYAMTTTVNNGRLFYQTPSVVVCLDAKTGAQQWQTLRPSPPTRPTWCSPTLVAYGDVVLSVDRDADVGPPPRGSRVHSPNWSRYFTGGPGKLIALSAATGKELWSCDSYDTHRAPGDVFVIDGLVWVGAARIRNTEDYTTGRDPLTGEVKRTIATAKAFEATHHHRCYRDKATDRFIVLARTGTEFIDIKEGKTWRNNWVRGECQFGVMPCNGLLYVPPHPCACYIQAKLNGFLVLAPEREAEVRDQRSEVRNQKSEDRGQQSDTARVERGPAYSDELRTPHSELRIQEWPTFRGDGERSGGVKASVTASGLRPAWRAEIGGRVTSPVMAEGRVFVASVDTHTVHALSADDGKALWQFTGGARVDSPPTIYRGRVVFGCRDGWVYCLRAGDGALAWRLRAAPAERHVVAWDQVESVWPVHGSILVEDDVAYCVAGRSSFLDGGLRLCALDMKSGMLLREHRIVGEEAGKEEDAGPKWVHVALTWDGKIAKGYVDGREKRATTREVKGKYSYKGLRIGHRLDRAFFKGPMDNIRIYRRVLSPKEIRAIHDAEKPTGTKSHGAPPTTHGLALHLSFDEGKGETAHDGSGNGHDATIHGASWVPHGNGHALQFNGEDAWLDCGDSEELNVSHPITLSAWIRPESKATTHKDTPMVLGSGPGHWNSPYCLSVSKRGFFANMNDAKTGMRYMISWSPKGRGLEMAGGLPDVLSCTGDTIYLRASAFDRKTLAPKEEMERHLFSSVGFLSDAWWHRTYWIYGTGFSSGAAGWYLAGREFPAGKLLAANDTTVFGYGLKPDYYRWATPLGYHLFAAEKNAEPVAIPRSNKRGRPGALPGHKFARRWVQDIPIHGRAMAVTDRALFVAGPPAVIDEDQTYGQLSPTGPPPAELLEAEAAFKGEKGGKLLAVQLVDGATLDTYSLPSPPVFDGLIAADGRLFMSTMDGAVVCFKPGNTPGAAPQR